MLDLDHASTVIEATRDRLDAIIGFLTDRIAELVEAGGVRKRLAAAIDELTDGPVGSGPDEYGEWVYTIELIASAWYDHPDYDEDWLPYE